MLLVYDLIYTTPIMNSCAEFIWGNIKYSMVNFLKNPHNRHPIARPLGRDMECLLCSQTLIYILPQSVQ